MSSGMELIFKQQELDEANRLLNYMRTAMRNAISEIKDGDEEAAIETLEQIVGKQS